jgi:hypothetical protein
MRQYPWQWSQTNNVGIKISNNIVNLTDINDFHSVFLEPTFTMRDVQSVKLRLTWDKKIANKMGSWFYGRIDSYPFYGQKQYIGFQLVNRDIRKKHSYTAEDLIRTNPFRKGGGTYAAQYMHCNSSQKFKHMLIRYSPATTLINSSQMGK